MGIKDFLVWPRVLSWAPYNLNRNPISKLTYRVRCKDDFRGYHRENPDKIVVTFKRIDSAEKTDVTLKRHAVHRNRFEPLSQARRWNVPIIN